VRLPIHPPRGAHILPLQSPRQFRLQNNPLLHTTKPTRTAAAALCSSYGSHGGDAGPWRAGEPAAPGGAPALQAGGGRGSGSGRGAAGVVQGQGGGVGGEEWEGGAMGGGDEAGGGGGQEQRRDAAHAGRGRQDGHGDVH
jgi:hypothetical protein